ncbi:hypothetical protein DFJ63DRAFT_312779 [Scheffersomyces coipomensis]|uniref:uncharacterized protein n=1 Tax=Scheffersomyces coipomensis TaxID=1788519 RepID=UPI00315D6970
MAESLSNELGNLNIDAEESTCNQISSLVVSVNTTKLGNISTSIIPPLPLHGLIIHYNREEQPAYNDNDYSQNEDWDYLVKNIEKLHRLGLKHITLHFRLGLDDCGSSILPVITFFHHYWTKNFNFEIYILKMVSCQNFKMPPTEYLEGFPHMSFKIDTSYVGNRDEDQALYICDAFPATKEFYP